MSVCLTRELERRLRYFLKFMDGSMMTCISESWNETSSRLILLIKRSESYPHQFVILCRHLLPGAPEPLHGPVAQPGGDGKHGVVVLGVLVAVVGDLLRFFSIV